MGEQSLVLNRRYALVLMCHDCGFDEKRLPTLQRLPRSTN
jgi:hypothetical protein